MGRLKIEHLIPYLEYGLPWLCQEDDDYEVLPMVGIEIKDGLAINIDEPWKKIKNITRRK